MIPRNHREAEIPASGDQAPSSGLYECCTHMLLSYTYTDTKKMNFREKRKLLSTLDLDKRAIFHLQMKLFWRKLLICMKNWLS